ncbi:MAG: beta-N-acetylhexosaminidase [Phycisphaerae bacterium]|nr:beta-N-acetylhexosaminidase [Phycisphaerae bacterium]
MKKKITVFHVSLFCFISLSPFFSGCKVGPDVIRPELRAMNKSISIIPEPLSYRQSEGSFMINSQTCIIVDEDLKEMAERFNEIISPAWGAPLPIKINGQAKNNIIKFVIASDLNDLSDEGYQLKVTNDRIVITAAAEAGIFYGLQTVRQLLPEQIFSKQRVSGVQWEIPCVEIEDRPRFQWRGMHLDVGRHYMPMDFIKKNIDFIAMHKMNVFHWHLTEDQGWRIEIKKYPKLTQIAAWRDETLVGHVKDAKKGKAKYDGKKHGGFYTQDDIREIVEYAKQHYVTVVPEIEMPGHCQAALAAYPELSCSGGPFEVGKKWGVSREVYCAGNEKTFEFLQDVLLEVLDLFPSGYIHVGGDECPKHRWQVCEKCQGRIQSESLKDEHELQSYFIKRIETFLMAHGRNLIGWDEILEGGLAPNAAVMSWRGEKGGIAAAKAGHRVVMAPNTYTYLNFYQADRDTEPIAQGKFLPLEKVYNYDPVPVVLTEQEARYILGAQGQLWTEYIPNPKHAEYMLFPRMSALAEVVWTQKEKKDYKRFYNNLEVHLKRLDSYETNYRRLDSMSIPQKNYGNKPNNQ